MQTLVPSDNETQEKGREATAATSNTAGGEGASTTDTGEGAGSAPVRQIRIEFQRNPANFDMGGDARVSGVWAEKTELLGAPSQQQSVKVNRCTYINISRVDRYRYIDTYRVKVYCLCIIRRF